jgi:PAS domain S-box-containing protein
MNAATPGPPLRLMAGLALSVLVPNLIFILFMLSADVIAPYDRVHPERPAHLLWVLLGAAVIAFVAGRIHRDCAADLEQPGGRDRVRRRLLRLRWLLPLAIVVHVLVGGSIMNGSVGLPAAFDGREAMVAVLCGLAIMALILVPATILCADEFGVLCAGLLEGEILVPGAVRDLAPALLTLLAMMLLPLHEFAVTGASRPGVLVLVLLVLPYLVVVTLLNRRYTRRSFRPVDGFLTASRDIRVEPADLRPASLDEYGELIMRLRQLIGSLSDSRDALAGSEGRLRRLAGAASDFFLELDADTRVIWVSERFEEITGVPPERILGLTPTGIGSLVAAREFETLLESVSERRSFRDLVYSIQPPGRTRLHIRMSAVALTDPDGRFSGYLATGTDITSVVAAEGRLRESARQLAQAQKMEAVGQLTGGVAHDFNNLLTAVLGSLELLRDERPELEDEVLIRDAIRAAERGADLVRRLLSFSRQQGLSPVVVELGAMIGDLSRLLERTLGARVVLELDLPEDPLPALVDRSEFESALLNLVINARDAMSAEGHLRITARIESRTRDRELSPGRYVRVSVTDTGSGIAPELLPHVFEPFFTTKETGGSGLGLSMIHGFARQSGGGVQLDSTVGVGTRVDLFLPAAEEATARSDDPGAVAARTPEPVARAIRILLVEDEEPVRRLVGRGLRQAGYQVVEAADGTRALALLGEAGPVDLVVSDVILPGGPNGVDVIRDAIDRGLPCIMISGHTAGLLDASDRSLASVPLLPKPFRLPVLLELVRNQVGVSATQ